MPSFSNLAEDWGNDPSGTVTGPTSFGSGALTNASSGTGNIVGIFAHELVLPGPFRGGDLGTSTSTWNNQTFATLGLTPGTYTWNWNNGAAPVDSFTLQILTPEPTGLSLLAFAGLTLLRRNRRA